MSEELAKLQSKIVELENEIKSLRKGVAVREKIEQMSSEVVDSNPYRYVTKNMYSNLLKLFFTNTH